MIERYIRGLGWLGGKIMAPIKRLYDRQPTDSRKNTVLIVFSIVVAGILGTPAIIALSYYTHHSL